MKSTWNMAWCLGSGKKSFIVCVCVCAPVPLILSAFSSTSRGHTAHTAMPGLQLPASQGYLPPHSLSSFQKQFLELGVPVSGC